MNLHDIAAAHLENCLVNLTGNGKHVLNFSLSLFLGYQGLWADPNNCIHRYEGDLTILIIDCLGLPWLVVEVFEVVAFDDSMTSCKLVPVRIFLFLCSGKDIDHVCNVVGMIVPCSDYDKILRF